MTDTPPLVTLNNNIFVAGDYPPEGNTPSEHSVIGVINGIQCRLGLRCTSSRNAMTVNELRIGDGPWLPIPSGQQNRLILDNMAIPNELRTQYPAQLQGIGINFSLPVNRSFSATVQYAQQESERLAQAETRRQQTTEGPVVTVSSPYDVISGDALAYSGNPQAGTEVNFPLRFVINGQTHQIHTMGTFAANNRIRVNSMRIDGRWIPVPEGENTLQLRNAEPNSVNGGINLNEQVNRPFHNALGAAYQESQRQWNVIASQPITGMEILPNPYGQAFSLVSIPNGISGQPNRPGGTSALSVRLRHGNGNNAVYTEGSISFEDGTIRHGDPVPATLNLNRIGGYGLTSGGNYFQTLDPPVTVTVDRNNGNRIPLTPEVSAAMETAVLGLANGAGDRAARFRRWHSTSAPHTLSPVHPELTPPPQPLRFRLEDLPNSGTPARPVYSPSSTPNLANFAPRPAAPERPAPAATPPREAAATPQAPTNQLPLTQFPTADPRITYGFARGQSASAPDTATFTVDLTPTQGRQSGSLGQLVSRLQNMPPGSTPLADGSSISRQGNTATLTLSPQAVSMTFGRGIATRYDRLSVDQLEDIFARTASSAGMPSTDLLDPNNNPTRIAQLGLAVPQRTSSVGYIQRSPHRQQFSQNPAQPYGNLQHPNGSQQPERAATRRQQATTQNNASVASSESLINLLTRQYGTIDNIHDRLAANAIGIIREPSRESELTRRENHLRSNLLRAEALRTDITNQLANSPAEINSRNSYGYTALHLAALGCDVEGVRTLLGRGARLDIANNERITPLQFVEYVTSGMGADNPHYNAYQSIITILRNAAQNTPPSPPLSIPPRQQQSQQHWQQPPQHASDAPQQPMGVMNVVGGLGMIHRQCMAGIGQCAAMYRQAAAMGNNYMCQYAAACAQQCSRWGFQQLQGLAQTAGQEVFNQGMQMFNQMQGAVQPGRIGPAQQYAGGPMPPPGGPVLPQGQGGPRI